MPKGSHVLSFPCLKAEGSSPDDLKLQRVCLTAPSYRPTLPTDPLTYRRSSSELRRSTGKMSATSSVKEQLGC